MEKRAFNYEELEDDNNIILETLLDSLTGYQNDGLLIFKDNVLDFTIYIKVEEDLYDSDTDFYDKLFISIENMGLIEDSDYTDEDDIDPSDYDSGYDYEDYN